MMQAVLLSALIVSTGSAAGAETVAVNPWAPTITELSLSSDVPVVVQRAYGGTGYDMAYDAQATHDGGFILTGSTNSAGAGGDDLVVLRLDRAGKLLWARTYGGSKDDEGFAIRQTPDGGYAVIGETESFGAGKGDVWFLRLNAKGDLLYQRTLGGTGEERGTGLALTRDGGFALEAETYSYGAGDSRFYLAKLDARGGVEWENTYDNGPLNERGLGIVAQRDGYLLTGNSMNTPSGETSAISDGYAVKTDLKGNKLWSRRYGTDKHDIFHAATQLASGTALITGYTQSYGAKGGNDVWALFIDRTGNVLRQVVFGGAQEDHDIAVTALADGGAYLGGYSQSWGAGAYDAQIVKLSAKGNVEWHHEIGGAKDDGATAVFPDGKGGAALIGFTESGGAGGRDILFSEIRLDSKKAKDAAG